MKAFINLKTGDNLYVNGIPERIYGIDKYPNKWLFYTTNNMNDDYRLECFTSELGCNTIYVGEDKFTSCEI